MGSTFTWIFKEQLDRLQDGDRFYYFNQLKEAPLIIADQFGTLEAIPPSVLDWQIDIRNASRLSATLEDHRADALLYRRLATLNRDARIDDVTGSLDELEWHGVPRDRFVALCEELGFDTVRERVHRWAD